ncbi:kinase-like domain-containing protein [Rhizophagus irregularis DAOM 181602=DAOM 197198]|nr:kinase-like domain-containing protein [Rhizophagus irregularis DAOM 181602=DAOM 197198]
MRRHILNIVLNVKHLIKKNSILWCNECETKLFKENFSYWTSEIDLLDEFIKKTQLTNSVKENYLKLIPFDEFENIILLEEGGYSKVYLAFWNNGLYFGTMKGWINKRKSLSSKTGELKLWSDRVVARFEYKNINGADFMSGMKRFYLFSDSLSHSKNFRYNTLHSTRNIIKYWKIQWNLDPEIIEVAEIERKELVKSNDWILFNSYKILKLFILVEI